MSPSFVHASSSRLRSPAVSRRLLAISASFPMLARAASWRTQFRPDKLAAMKRVAVLVSILGALVLIGSGSAFVGRTDPTATISRNGHVIRATGPVTCDIGERFSLRLTITQTQTAA